MPSAKTQDEPAEKPARNRRVAQAAPDSGTVPTARPPADRNLYWAVGVLGAIAAFFGGFAVGHVVTEDDAPRAGQVVLSERLPGGMGPMGYPGSGIELVPGYPGGGVEVIPMYPGHEQVGVIEGGGYLGVSLLDRPGAVEVVEVEPGSPADVAGIEEGDRILAYAGTEVVSGEQLQHLVRSTEPGTTVEILLGGGGEERTVTAVIGERPAEQ